MLGRRVVFSKAVSVSVLALALGCGPADTSWAHWDFAFLSVEPAGSAGDPRAILMLGASPDGGTAPTQPERAVSSREIAWSPSGDAIAYMDAADGEAAEAGDWYEGLWAATSSDRERLARLSPANAHARHSTRVAWSPSGRWLTIGMSTSEPQGLVSGGWHLFAVDLDADPDARTLELWPDAAEVSWAPDGGRYVATFFDKNVDDEYRVVAGPGDLYTYDLESLRETWLEINTEAEEKSAAWSPDGEWIAYVSDATGAQEILRWPLSGGTPRGVGPAPCAVASLEWFRDGGALLVQCDGEAFAIVDAERGTILAEHEGTAASASPDGGRVIFERDATIHVLDLRGGGSAAIGPGRAPAWRPMVGDR